MIEFAECNECRKKPGSPVLCQQCLMLRQLVGEWNDFMKSLKNAPIAGEFSSAGMVVMSDGLLPAERAAAILWGGRSLPLETRNQIADAIHAAVADEREACAKLAEQEARYVNSYHPTTCAKIAAAIRGRGE